MGRRRALKDLENVTEKKSFPIKPVIVGVITTVVLAGIITIFVLFGKKDYSGRYVCETFASLGIDYYLEISGDEVSCVITYDTDGDGGISDSEKQETNGTISFDGDKCVLSFDGSEFEGVYNKDEKTITLDNLDDSQTVFVKNE